MGRARCEKLQKSGEHPEANNSQGPLTPQEGGERCLPDNKCALQHVTKRRADVTKLRILKWRIWPWILQIDQSHANGPYKRETWREEKDG